MTMILNPNTDSVDHINIYSRGVTQLGRFLSNFTLCPIEISLGKFNSLEGLIYFLGSFDNSLRSLHGNEAKELGRAIDRGIRLPKDVFESLIHEAMRAKLDANPLMKDLFTKSTLPFSHYHVKSGIARAVPKWNWQIELWEEIRADLKSRQNNK